MFRPEADRLQNWDFVRPHIECWKKQKHFISDDDYKSWLDSVNRIDDRRKRKLSGSKDDPCQVKRSKSSVASTQTVQTGAISIDEGIGSDNGDDLDDNSEGVGNGHSNSQTVDNGQGGGSGHSTVNDSGTQEKTAVKKKVDAKDANGDAKESNSEEDTAVSVKTDEMGRNKNSAEQTDGSSKKAGRVEKESDDQKKDGVKKAGRVEKESDDQKKDGVKSDLDAKKGAGGEKANGVKETVSVKINANAKKDPGNMNAAVGSGASAKNYNGGEKGKAGSQTNMDVESLEIRNSDHEGDDGKTDEEEFDSNAMIPPLGHSSDKDNG